MLFRKDSPQTEGRRDADPLIKTSPVSVTFIDAVTGTIYLFTLYGLTSLLRLYPEKDRRGPTVGPTANSTQNSIPLEYFWKRS